MSYIYDIAYGSPSGAAMQDRGRVNRVVDQAGNFLWFEAVTATDRDGNRMLDGAFADFTPDGSYLGLTADEIARARTRVAKSAHA